MYGKMKFSRELDGDTIDRLGLLDYNTEDLHPFELYGIRNSDNWHSFLLDHWHYSIYLSMVYVILIYVGQMYMRDRPAFDLRRAMTIWSSLLAVASIVATYRSMNVLWAVMRDYGFMYSVCHPHFYYNSNAIWGAFFIVSKPLELGDTAFIVLRKQPLIFLHWYHHITVMIYVFLSFHEHSSLGLYFYVVNFAVHGVMYTYYALKSMRVRMPPFVPVTVTSIQLSQMVLGTVVLLYALVFKSRDSPCQISWRLLYLGLAMYLSYFLLFGHFFYHAYCKGKFWTRSSPPRPHKFVIANGFLHNGSGDSPSNGSLCNGTNGLKASGMISNGKKIV